MRRRNVRVGTFAGLIGGAWKWMLLIASTNAAFVERKIGVPLENADYSAKCLERWSSDIASDGSNSDTLLAVQHHGAPNAGWP